MLTKTEAITLTMNLIEEMFNQGINEDSRDAWEYNDSDLIKRCFDIYITSGKEKALSFIDTVEWDQEFNLSDPFFGGELLLYGFAIINTLTSRNLISLKKTSTPVQVVTKIREDKFVTCPTCNHISRITDLNKFDCDICGNTIVPFE